MNLDCVVGVLVAVFAAEAFHEWGAGVGELAVALHLGALLLGEIALAGYVFVDLVHVDKAGGLVEEVREASRRAFITASISYTAGTR